MTHARLEAIEMTLTHFLLAVSACMMVSVVLGVALGTIMKQGAAVRRVVPVGNQAAARKSA
jgi:hypothetical protein